MELKLKEINPQHFRHMMFSLKKIHEKAELKDVYLHVNGNMPQKFRPGFKIVIELRRFYNQTLTQHHLGDAGQSLCPNMYLNVYLVVTGALPF